VHEENQQLIYFQNVDAAERRLQQESTKRTMLMAWFELNANDIEARKIYYQDIPSYYRWMPALKIWQKRVDTSLGLTVIGRIYGVMPNETER